jgi:hypothetical protein
MGLPVPPANAYCWVVTMPRLRSVLQPKRSKLSTPLLTGATVLGLALATYAMPVTFSLSKVLPRMSVHCGRSSRILLGPKVIACHMFG